MALTVVHKAKKKQFADERRQLMGSSALYGKNSHDVLGLPSNDNKFGVVSTAMASFHSRIEEHHEEANDYANALITSDDEHDWDADSASASRNHFLSAMEEIRDNKDLDSPEAVKLFLNEVRVHNAAEVLIAGKSFGYALDSIDYVIDFLIEIGKGDVKKGIEELQSGKVGEERLENRASVVSEKVTLQHEQAEEMARIVNRSNIRNMPVNQAVAEFNNMVNDKRLLPDSVGKVLDKLDKEVIEKVVEKRDADKETKLTTNIYNKDTKSFTNDTFIAMVASEIVQPKKKKDQSDSRKKEEETYINHGDMSRVQREAEQTPNLMTMTFNQKGNLVPPPNKPKSA